MSAGLIERLIEARSMALEVLAQPTPIDLSPIEATARNGMVGPVSEDVLLLTHELLEIIGRIKPEERHILVHSFSRSQIPSIVSILNHWRGSVKGEGRQLKRLKEIKAPKPSDSSADQACRLYWKRSASVRAGLAKLADL